MTFQLSFDCENAAFDTELQQEISAILHEVSYRVERGLTKGTVSDSNGNRVGEWSLKS